MVDHIPNEKAQLREVLYIIVPFVTNGRKFGLRENDGAKVAELPKQGYQYVLLVIDSNIVPTMNTIKGTQHFHEVTAYFLSILATHAPRETKVLVC